MKAPTLAKGKFDALTTHFPQRRKKTAFLLFLLFSQLVATSAFSQWVPGYSYKSKITIQGSQICGSATLTNFPVLIQTAANFLRPSPTGLISNANGYDIIFTAADQTTILNHQIDHYNSVTGQYSAWVKIPAMTPGADLDIYMYYGNSAVATDPSVATTWDPSFNTIYHFENNNFNDATANAVAGTDNGTSPASAKIGEGRDLNGTSGYIQSNSNLLATANNFTISAWFKADATTPGHIIWQGALTENGWGNGGASGQELNLSMGTCCPGGTAPGGFLSFFMGDREEQLSTDALHDEVAFTNTTDWQYVVATVRDFDTSPVADLFLNGTLVASNTGVVGPVLARTAWNSPLRIGRPGAASRFFNGQVDEVRIADVVRNAGWICTEYNNQNNPSGFISIVNRAPDLAAIEGTTLSFTEDNPAVAITTSLTAADWDDATLSSATIQITGNYTSGEDVLDFTNAFGITGSWDVTTGTLTLSGVTTIANYQSALRTVTYRNTNTANPSALVRTVSFTANDGNSSGAAVTRNISINTINDAPVLSTIEAAALAYAEDQAATAITSTLAVADGDNTNLTGATVRISTNFQSGQDVLAFTNAFGITGSYAAATGILTLTGSSSVANYEAALRSVTYRNTNSVSPSTLTRTVSFVVSDGALNSNIVTRNITVTLVNDPPVLSAIETTSLTYNESQAATVITSAISVADVDNANITGATIQITGNYLGTEDVLSYATALGITGTFDGSTGTLVLTGTTTLANYRTALRAVRYQNTNNDNPSTLARTVSFTVTDGTDNSNTVTRNINVNGVNDAPVLSAMEGTALSYTEEQAATPISATIVVADVDNANIASATVQITTNYSNGADVLAFTNTANITGTFTVATGLMTLSGSATRAEYQAALRAVTFVNTNTANPSISTRTVTFRVNDGTANSNTQTRNIAFTPLNDAPVLSNIETTALAYTESQAATNITANINVVDVDLTNLSGATIQITGNYLNTEDVLAFTNASGITGNFDAATGTMTLTGSSSIANYRTALRNVRYQNTNNNNPSTLPRTVSFTVTDGTDASNTVTRDINVTGVNDVPVLSAIEGVTLPYTEDAPATAITSTITIADVDNTTMSGATVQMTGNYQNTQDVLGFVSALGITSTYNTTNGLLTLSGSASISDYITALRSVTYQNTNLINPSTAVRTVTFRVSDGAGQSNTQTRTITITPVNDAPILSAIETTDLAYTEDQAATVITATTAISDLDNTNLAGATVQITGNFVSTEDVLSFTNAFGVTGSYNAATGTMTLTGNTTVANYQSAIRSVRYRNTNLATPSPLTRTVSYTVSDATLSSNTVVRNITVTPVNDAPTVVNDAVTISEEQTVVVNVLANDSDVDDTIDNTTVTITVAPLNGTATVDPVTGEVTYVPNLDFSGTNTFRYTVKDVFGTTSAQATVTITVNNINDPPTFTGGADYTVNEDAGAQTVVGWATAMNDGDPFTTQTLSFVVTNTNNGLFATQPAINATTGTLTFRSNNNASGTATVTVILRDNGSATLPNVRDSNPYTFTITVFPVNDPPTPVDDFYSTSSNTPLTANFKSNDTDPESNTTTATTTAIVQPLHGTVTIQPNGNFTYTPDGSFTGEDTFKYEVCDNGTDNGVPASRCSQATVTVTVNPPNAYYNIVGNNSIQISTHCFILTKNLLNQQGAVWNRFPLDLRYSFELNFATMLSDTGVVNDTGADGIVFALQRDDTPPPLNVAGSPIDARGTVGEYLGVGGVSPSIAIEVDTYMNAGEPAYDHIAISKNGSVYDILSPPVPAKVDGSNNPLDIEDGLEHTVRISWDKPTNTLRVYFDGIVRSTYTDDVINSIFGGDPTNIYWGFSASTGGQRNYQAVCGIDMLPINLPAVPGNDVASTDEDVVLNGTSVLVNDADPEQGTLSVVAETKVTAHGNVVIHADGTYVYTPAPDYHGADSFTYQVCDGYSTPGCATGTVNVTVHPTSDNPVAVAESYSVPEDNTLAIAAPGVLGNDTDADGDVLSATVVSSTSHGTLTLNANGSFTYVPAPDYNGADSFTYQVNDGANNSNVVTVSLSVTAVNDAPVAVNDVVSTNEDTPLPIVVLTNDTDVDDALDMSSVVITVNPAHGTLSIDMATGVITFTPDGEYSGTDSFSYTVKDQTGAASNVATVSITVNPVNDPPIALNDNAIVDEDQSVVIAVAANDADIDDALVLSSVIIVSQPLHGTVTVNTTTGAVTYTPLQDYNGVDSFTYTIKDQAGAVSAVATVNVTISPVNDAPVAVPDNVTAVNNTTLMIRVLDNDVDVDGVPDPATVTIAGNPVHGIAVVDPATGVITYTPASGYEGNDSFTYSFNDESGTASNVVIVSIVVVPPNRAPVAVNDMVEHYFFTSLIIDVLANDSDIDGDPMTIVGVSTPNTGSVTIEGDHLVYHPAGMESGVVTFTYTIADPDGLTATATVTVNYEFLPLTVSEGFSPNGDENNEFWYMKGIESFPVNSVKVFDRWGLLVYQVNNYDNLGVRWEGRANRGMESGKLVDQGTYYYKIDIEGQSKPLSGYVVILR